MRSSRQTDLRRAILAELASLPAGLPMRERLLRAYASRAVSPAATLAELDIELRAAEEARLLARLPGEDDMQCKLIDAGRFWLAENP